MGEMKFKINERKYTATLWVALFRSETHDYFIRPKTFTDGMPALFKTKKQCKAWINENYGYIKTRKDLRESPHFWRLPIPTPVSISIEREV